MDKQTLYGIRSFNRFYSKVLGLLDSKIVNTEYSLTEGRVLFEISERKECIANELVTELNIDRSYMSRILRKLAKDNLIKKQSSTTDSRKNQLLLTEKGQEVLDEINRKTDEQIEQLFSNLTVSEIEEINSSMKEIRKKLGNKKISN